jgi:hypothetical protein
LVIYNEENVIAILKLEFPDTVEGLQELRGISLSETGAIILRVLLRQTVEGGLAVRHSPPLRGLIDYLDFIGAVSMSRTAQITNPKHKPRLV